MSVIYTPKGKAREYSPLALNLYLQCIHGCKYCYAPSALQKTRECYFQLPEPRKNIINLLEKDLLKNAPKEQVLLSFIGDVYSPTSDNNSVTKQALELLNQYNVPVAILTKSGKTCLKDLEVFKKFNEHIQIGTTLTFLNKEKSLEWEPKAALPEDRLFMLKELHRNGIKTFVSFEPVIESKESIELIKETLKDNSVDVYKIGKINNYNGIDRQIDWNDFLSQVLDILRPTGKGIYIKHDLRLSANKVKLYGNEVLSDEFNVR